MFAFDLNDSAFSAPEMNAPRPCKHASNCYYNGAGGCAFVHPGEEGIGFKIFPARTVRADGKETWQKATVRLIGGAQFYERRRLKMSWPEWCALKKNSHLVATSYVPVATQKADIQTILANAQKAYKRQEVGDALYSRIQPFLAANEADMKAANTWHPLMTAGKLTGILLEGLSYDECLSLTQNQAALEDRLAEACDVILAA